MWQEEDRALSKAPQIGATVRKPQWQGNPRPGSWPQPPGEPGLTFLRALAPAQHRCVLSESLSLKPPREPQEEPGRISEVSCPIGGKEEYFTLIPQFQF